MLKPMAIIFSIFTRIAMPRFVWDEKSRRRAVLYFPLVGCMIGGAELLIRIAASMLHLPMLTTALLLLAGPIILTGGIHLDGLIDTADARHSFGDMEERKRILKDPHVGAFGVIRLALYLLVAAAVIYGLLDRKQFTLQGARLLAIGYGFVLSRAFVTAEVLFFSPAKNGGMLGMLRDGTTRAIRAAAVFEAVGALAVLFVLLPMTNATVILLTQIGFVLYFYGFSKHMFGGISGDLMGWYICLAELLYLIGVWL